MKAEKILFVTQEINPYVPASTLTELGRELPLGTIDQGREIRAFMPKWGNINERRNQLHEVIRLSGMNLIIDDTDHPLLIKVASITGTRMQVYFIDNEDFFGKRLQEAGEDGIEYTDNVERAVFYARGVLETVKKLRWTPDVIHCQGWISSILPVYLKTAYAEEPSFRDCRVVYTVTDNQLTRSTGPRMAHILEYRNAGKACIQEFGQDLSAKQLEMLAIKYADGVTFHSPTPDAELLAYAQQAGKFILMESKAEAERYVPFFDQILSESKSQTND